MVESKSAVGFMQLYPSFSSVSMQPIWIVNDLFVVEEARRRGVEAIVLAAEEPTRMRGGRRMGGRGGPRYRSVGETTRYVIEKAPCRVILSAPPLGEEGTREGVAP
jgi:hypothetical protein